jgi:hypothetical protein
MTCEQQLRRFAQISCDRAHSRELFIWARLQNWESDYYFSHVCLSVRPPALPHGTNRLSLEVKLKLPQEGFSLTFMFEDFWKIC